MDEAVDALRRAAAYQDPPAPPWTLAWLSGLVNREQGHLAEAEENLRSVLEDRTPEMMRRGFDFSRDYEVINELGLTLFFRAQQVLGERRRARTRVDCCNRRRAVRKDAHVRFRERDRALQPGA